MNIKIIAAAVFGIIILGLGGLLFYNQNAKNQSPQENVQVQEQKDEEKNLLDILSLGSNQTCDFTYNDEESNNKTDGTAFVTKDKLRVDFDLTDDKGKVTSMSLIRNGDTNYIWGTSLEQGVKITIPEEEFSKDEEIKKYFDTERKTDFECKSWTVDNSKFNPPSNIEFFDLSSFGITPPKSNESGASQCGVCNSLTGDAKTTCLQSLNCPR